MHFGAQFDRTLCLNKLFLKHGFFHGSTLLSGNSFGNGPHQGLDVDLDKARLHLYAFAHIFTSFPVAAGAIVQTSHVTRMGY